MPVGSPSSDPQSLARHSIWHRHATSLDDPDRCPGRDDEDTPTSWRLASLVLGWVACLVLMPGCGRDDAAAAATVESAAPAAAGPEAPTAAHLVRRSRELMGTVFYVQVVVADAAAEAAAGRAAQAALDEVARIEALLSEWRPDSEISRINAAAGKRPVPVGPDTLAVVQAGLEVSRWSEGAFDLSWAALRGLYDFRRGHRKRPDPEQLKALLPLVRYGDVEVDLAGSRVFLKRAGMQLGTGSIGKGYALDRAAAVLRRAGWQSFMLFGGGQVQVSGHNPQGRPWRIGVQNPRAPDHLGHIELSGGSVSTSGDYEHAFIEDGRRWHHILDPRTGLPAPHTSSVTVVAKNGMYADAISTALFVLGPKAALDRLASAPGAPEAIVVDAALNVQLSPGLREQFVARTPSAPVGSAARSDPL